MSPYFSTSITELFGIELPILCGGLMWLSTAEYVAATVNAGAMGFITPRSFTSLEHFREEVQHAAYLTKGKPFGVNLYISGQADQNRQLHEWLEIALSEGVRHFETAGYSPSALLPKLKESGSTVIHKCTTIRHALRAEKDGVDAVSLVGSECGGHPGRAITSASTLGALASRSLKVPYVIGGGIGTGEQLLAALSLGAGGVLMGSRMLVSEEIWASEMYKQHLISLGDSDTRTVLSSFGKTYRCLNNKTAQKVAELEQSGEKDFSVYKELVAGSQAYEAYQSGNFEKGILSLGPAISFADQIEPASHILEAIVSTAIEAHKRLDNLTVRGKALDS